MNTLKTRLHSIEYLAEGILAFEFRPVESEALPAVSAGSHIDVHLPNGQMRSYSLVNISESHRYIIGVNRDANGRGGSRYLHDTLKVGAIIEVSPPRNTFALNENAEHNVLIAGGIGITPLWSMIQRLQKIGKSWHLFYSARSINIAAYTKDIEAVANQSGGEVTFNFDGGDPSKMLNMAEIVASSPPESDFYCCGPGPMIRAYDEATRDLPRERVHREYFAPPVSIENSTAPNECSSLSVHLARSGITLTVAPDVTILDAALEAGIDAPYSCMSGICGACKTTVLEGTPDHQDFVLTEAEQTQGNCMMICCSRAKSASLTLDL